MSDEDKAQGIEQSLELSIVDENLKNLTTEVVEVSLDNLLNDGILKDLPIVGWLAKIYAFGANVRDKLFLKKVLSFLNQLKDIPSEKRKNVIEKINNDKKYRINIGEKLLYIIDSCNDYENSERTGILFRHLLKEDISRAEFEKIASILSSLSTNDFNRIIKISKQLSKDEKERKEKTHYDNEIYLEEVSDLLYFGIFDIHYTEPTIKISNNDYPDGYKSNPMNKYLAEIIDGISGYIRLNDTGKVLIRIFNGNN